VFASFSDSAAAGLWHEYGVDILLLTLIGATVLLALALLLTTAAARLLRFPVEDEIVAVFCGSKKTLAAGVPMAKVLFGTHPGLGLIVLPVMFYHQLQLVVCAVLAQRYARRDLTKTASPQ
jgi:sodium/bile acid cotransporter 7